MGTEWKSAVLASTTPVAVACKAGWMTEPYATNGLCLAFAGMLYGEEADADAAEQAFNSTDGTFLERITAAINALLRHHLKPERFIEIPENPELMARADLDALVRLVAEGFLRSQPTKDELLSQLQQIARRQASRPSWMPRTDDSPSADNGPEASEEFSRPVSVTLSGFPELGEVTIAAPAYYGDVMYDADSKHPAVLQITLLTVFGATDASAAGRTIRGEWDALDALVPAERRWWLPPEMTPTPRAAAEDAGGCRRSARDHPIPGGHGSSGHRGPGCRRADCGCAPRHGPMEAQPADRGGWVAAI